MTIKARCIMASRHPRTGVVLTTYQLYYPAMIHAELLTHRVFSRNSSSFRAIPVQKMISACLEDPAMPEEWGSNKAGMQAGDAIGDVAAAKEVWLESLNRTVDQVKRLVDLGLHKQIANRLLHPFTHMHTVVTATEWDNFFSLRYHEDADPTMRKLAETIYEAPCTILTRSLHTPYAEYGTQNDRIVKSVACCARVSYAKHDGTISTPEDDKFLHDRLLSSRHFSPFEHVATAALDDGRYRNFTGGWIQYRCRVDT